DCKVLVDIVEKGIGDWRNKALSFADRLQLITSVLAFIQVYWSSLFVLPMNVCDIIDRMFKRLLWNKGDVAKGMTSVSWKNV
ncbi:hypothetical protein Tco_1488922, partial [Tanacetum coccineum]